MRTSDFQQIVGVICGSNDAKIAVFDKIIGELSRQEFIKNDTVMQIFSSCFQPMFEYEATNARSSCDIDVAKRLGIPEKTVVKLKDEYFVRQFKYSAVHRFLLPSFQICTRHFSRYSKRRRG